MVPSLTAIYSTALHTREARGSYGGRGGILSKYVLRTESLHLLSRHT